MPIAAAFAGSAAVDCCGNAARSWSDEINICTMRRVHLRGRENILKRLVIHSGAANLGLLKRKLFGKGTPRGLQRRPQPIIPAEKVPDASCRAQRCLSRDFITGWLCRSPFEKL